MSEPHDKTKERRDDAAALAEARRGDLVALLARATLLAEGRLRVSAAEQRVMLDACRTAVTIHAALVEFEREHGWLAADGAAERDWQKLVTGFTAAARRHNLDAAVVDEMLDALGAG